MTLHWMEFIIVLAIMIIAWVSFSFDHEGEWINSVGDRIMITQSHTNWVATSKNASIYITKPVGTSIKWTRDDGYSGDYDRWSGTFIWKSDTRIEVWRRVTNGKGRQFLDWLAVRNTLKHWTPVGMWIGVTNSGKFLILEIKLDSAKLKFGELTDMLRLVPTLEGDIELLDSIGDVYTFKWDGFARGNLLIHNESVVIERID